MNCYFSDVTPTSTNAETNFGMAAAGVDRKVFYESDDHSMIIYRDEIEAIVNQGELSHLKPRADWKIPPKFTKYTHCVIADSGFGCVRLVVAGAKLGLAFIVSVKTAHSCFPKDELEAQMKDAPSGLWLTLETVIDGVEVLAIGYKYNAKKVLLFCAPKGAGGNYPGIPYEAKFPGANGGLATREVLRLVLLSRYFAASPKVDNHNQRRQHELALEEQWVTQDCWFRLTCTLYGITTIDSLLALKAMVPPGHKLKTITTEEFVDELCQEMINNKLAGHEEAGLRRDTRPAAAAAAAAAAAEVDAALPDPHRHHLACLGKKSEEGGWTGFDRGGKEIKDGPIKGRCVICARPDSGRPSGSLTTFYCAALACALGDPVYLCRDGSGHHTRNCLQVHIDHCAAMAAAVTGGGQPNKRRWSAPPPSSFGWGAAFHV